MKKNVFRILPGMLGMVLALCLLVISPVRAENPQPDPGVTQDTGVTSDAGKGQSDTDPKEEEGDGWMLCLRTVEDLQEGSLDGAQYTLSVKTNGIWETVSGKTQMSVSKDGYELGTLVNGEYRLVVDQSPTAYMTIGKPVEFQVTESGIILLHDPENATITKTDQEYLLTIYFALEYDITTVLPTTGGSGTFFYTVSGILLVVAGIGCALFCKGTKKTTLFVLAAAMLAAFANPSPVMAAGENWYYVLMKIADSNDSADYFVESKELADALATVTVDGQAFCTVSHEESSSYWDITINDAIDPYSDATANALAEVKDLAITSGALAGSSVRFGYGAFVLLEGEDAEYAVIDNMAPKALVARGKNSYPTITFTDTSDRIGEIGQTVTFTVNTTVPSNYGTVTLYAEFPKGLTPGTAVNITGSSTATNQAWTVESSDSNGKVTCTLQLPEGSSSPTTLQITYTATINGNAETAVKLAQNSYLKCNNDNYQTSSVTCNVYTMGFDLYAKNKNEDGSYALSNCEFTLQNEDGKYYQGDTANPRFATGSKSVTTDADGKISFAGLAAGTYTLTETKAADHYQGISSAVTITVADNGAVTVSGSGAEVTNSAANASGICTGTVTISHTSTTPMPSTGGNGTFAFYGMGVVMFMCSGVFFFLFRRKNGKADA